MGGGGGGGGLMEERGVGGGDGPLIRNARAPIRHQLSPAPLIFHWRLSVDVVDVDSGRRTDRFVPAPGDGFAKHFTPY